MRKKLSNIKYADPVKDSGHTPEELEHAMDVAEQAVGDTDGREMVAFKLLELAKEKNYSAIVELVEEMVQGNDIVMGTDGKTYRLSTLWGKNALTGKRARRVLGVISFRDPDLYKVLMQRKLTGVIAAVIGLTAGDTLPLLLGYCYSPEGEEYDINEAMTYGEAISDNMTLAQQLGALLSFFSATTLLRKAVAIL